jgi:Fe-S-cluster-containing dehydrogenase component
MSKKGRSAMRLSRRDFLKFSVPATTGLVVAGATGSGLVAAAASTSDPNLSGWALLYNTMLCQGPSCRSCTTGCREWNVLTPPNPAKKSNEVEPLQTNTWTAINDEFVANADGTKTHHFFKAQCRHCTNASCVSACPTGAMAYHGEYTVPDQGWCIGCGYCHQACPFGVPQLGEPKHTSTKCRFCFNLLSTANPDPKWLDPDTLTDPVLKGKSTSCALRCPVRPVKALRFGKRADLIKMAQSEIADIKAGKNPYQVGKPSLATNPVGSFKTAPPDLHLYGDSPDISGGSHVLFILEQKNEFYGIQDQTGLTPGRMFPAEAKYAAAKVPASWGTGVATSAALAILPFWLLFRRKQQMEAGQKSGVQGGTK